MTPSKVLLVEDNTALAAGIAYNLQLEGYDIRTVEDGRDAIAIVAQWNPDIVLLDLMLPGADGYQVLQAIRRSGNEVPVMILSARGEEPDKVRGFRLDADQYVTKPFGILELIERTAALLRRRNRSLAQEADGKYAFGSVELYEGSRTVYRDGVAVALSPKAFDLLLALVKRRGAVVNRVDLLKEVWGYGSFIMTRTVDSHIAELRRKLDDADNPRHFVTVWKIGYRFVE